jgi:enoyl-CoA hydratase
MTTQTAYENLLVEKQDHIALVTFNRPKALNALSSAVLAEIDCVVSELMSDNDLWGVIFTGSGEKAFIAGADIRELSTLNAASAPHLARELQRVFTRVETMTKPTIAAVNGFCLGGGNEFAMACHMRIASENARFGQPEVHLGIIPGAMGTIRLPRLVGKGRAMELILSGRMIKADEAYRIGLVNHVVEPEKLIEKCREILGEIFKQGPLAVRFALESIHHGLQMSADEGGNLESDLFGLCFATEDAREGLGAFLEKRDPQFKCK